MNGGLIALAAAVAAATMLGFALRRSSGQFRTGPPKTAPTAAGAGATVLTEADLGSRLGEQATLVQFSTTFCAPRRPTRQILAQLAGMVDGVTHVEIDADRGDGGAAQQHAPFGRHNCLPSPADRQSARGETKDQQPS